MRTTRWPLIGLVAVLVAGCTVGPTYRQPEVAVPATWRQAEVAGVTTGAAALAEWWRGFEDPVLNRLVKRAIAANFDLKIATARVREARAARGVAAGEQVPALNASGTYQRIRESENVQHPPGFEVNQNLFQSGLDASWEIDFWGRVRRAVEAADATLQAAEENRRDVLVILLAEVARNYVEVRAAQQRLSIARHNIQTQQETVELTHIRFQAGLGSEVDVAQADTLLATTRAQVPVLQAAQDQAIHRLGVLLGQAPESLVDDLRPGDRIPMGPATVPVGLPADLLRRRADVRRAERELAASTAQIGVATADLFPRVTLTGTLGLAASDASDFFRGGSRFSAIGPQIVWPVFAGGRIRANIRVQEARQEAALDRYKQAVLEALEEAENSLVNYGQEQTRRKALAVAVDSSQLALRLSLELYARGLADFLSVLDNQRAVYAAEDQLVRSDGTVATDLIALYKALGGGWEVSPQAEEPAPTDPATRDGSVVTQHRQSTADAK